MDDSNRQLARNLTGALGLILLGFSVLAFHVAISEWSIWPAFAGAAAAYGAYIWLRVSYLAHRDEL